MTSRAITLDDVARLAGVSYQTVSRVLNHSQQVSPRTRAKVEAAMQQLNYVPNRVAQQLAGKATRTLGLATSDLALMAPAQIASAIQQRASRDGYHLVIAMRSYNSAAETVNELLAQRVDALMINLPLSAAEAEQIQTLCGDKPAIFMDVEPQAQVAQCQYSNARGARAAVEHLIALGHRQIGLLSGPAQAISAQLREAAWREALAAHRLTPFCALRGDWSAQSGYQAMLQQLPDRLPQALLVANDQMALGVLRACAAKGIAVPEQISVVGYDDTDDSAWFSPPLTTVRQAFKEAGARSVEWLLNSQTQGEDLCRMRLPVSLVERHSSAPQSQQKESGEALARRLQQLAEQVALLNRR